jgi:hypothetical protein
MKILGYFFWWCLPLWAGLAANLAAGEDTSELVTAVTLLLNRWASDRAVRAKNAAVAGLRLQQRFAVGTLVEILTCIRGHDLSPRVATARARQHGLKDNCVHGLAMSFEGKPASVVA